MASFVLLMNWTEQGLRGVKEWSKRGADARHQIEAQGGKVTSVYLTMGPYDMVVTIDGIDDVAMAKLALGFGQLGNVRTTTLRAFPEGEAVRLIQGMGTAP